MDSTETQLPVACNRREELFWRKVGPPNDRGCRLWTGVPDRKGYGASCFKGLSTAEYARGNRSQQAIADQYGISQSQIGRIVRGVNRANA